MAAIPFAYPPLHIQVGYGGHGFYVDIMQTDALPIRQDWTAVRMNVDDFFSAYSVLLSRGFRNAYVDRTAETASSRSTLMLAPSG